MIFGLMTKKILGHVDPVIAVVKSRKRKVHISDRPRERDGCVFWDRRMIGGPTIKTVV